MINPYSSIPPGIWQAQLTLEPGKILNFNFEVIYDDNDSVRIELINGNERIEVRDISFGRTQSFDDTIRIDFPVFDTYIDAQFKENVMEGHWVVNYRENYAVPFVAYHGRSYRFSTQNKKPALDLSGSWNATFEIETAKPYPAIGEFEQDKNRVLGTFITETGDYRYLEGEIQGNELKLSCFDGSHAFLFIAEVTDNGDLIGSFNSGSHYKTNWVASRSAPNNIKSPFELSKSLKESETVSFSLPNSDDVLVSLSDPSYLNKPVILCIMGTWCPNCLEESKFLINYLESHPEKDIKILAIAYEKYRDKEKALSMIKNYKKRLNIPYEIVYGGYYDKEEASNTNGIIDKILAYPTMVLLNKDHKITNVYTGFYGSATSEHENFKQEFDQLIVELIKS